jgi:hypothetical protein
MRMIADSHALSKDSFQDARVERKIIAASRNTKAHEWILYRVKIKNLSVRPIAKKEIEQVRPSLIERHISKSNCLQIRGGACCDIGIHNTVGLDLLLASTQTFFPPVALKLLSAFMRTRFADSRDGTSVSVGARPTLGAGAAQQCETNLFLSRRNVVSLLL